MNEDEDPLERLNNLLEGMSELIDTCENFIALAENKFMTAFMKANALKSGMEEVRDKIKTLYFENGGYGVWAGEVEEK